MGIDLVKRIKEVITRRETLHSQVFNAAKSRGWDDVAANTAATDAVEICGSNTPLPRESLRSVVAEVCRVN